MGKDSSSLGRWVWSLYSGRNNIKLRAISAYLCGTGEGIGLVYNQQRRHLLEIRDSRTPKNKILDKLLVEITIWIDNGEYIVLAIDLNNHVISSEAALKI